MQTEIPHSSQPWRGWNTDWDTFQQEVWVFGYQRSQEQEKVRLRSSSISGNISARSSA